MNKNYDGTSILMSLRYDEDMSFSSKEGSILKGDNAQAATDAARVRALARNPENWFRCQNISGEDAMQMLQERAYNETIAIMEAKEAEAKALADYNAKKAQAEELRIEKILAANKEIFVKFGIKLEKIVPISELCVPKAGTVTCNFNNIIADLKDFSITHTEVIEETVVRPEMILTESFQESKEGYFKYSNEINQILKDTLGIPSKSVASLANYNKLAEAGKAASYKAAKWVIRNDAYGTNEFQTAHYIAHIDWDVKTSQIKDIVSIIEAGVPTSVVVRPETPDKELYAEKEYTPEGLEGRYTIFSDVLTEDIIKSSKHYAKRRIGDVKPLTAFLVDFCGDTSTLMEALSPEEYRERSAWDVNSYANRAMAHAYQAYANIFREDVHGIEENYAYIAPPKEEQDKDHPFKITKDAVKCRKHFAAILTESEWTKEKEYLDYVSKLFEEGDDTFNPKYFGYVICPDCGAYYTEGGRCHICGYEDPSYSLERYFDDNEDLMGDDEAEIEARLGFESYDDESYDEF